MAKSGKYTKEDAERERLAKGPNRGAEMHPDDKDMHAEGRKYGAAHAAEFCRAHKAEIEALIATYADELAEQLLRDLREQFWARVWTPTASEPVGEKP